MMLAVTLSYLAHLASPALATTIARGTLSRAARRYSPDQALITVAPACVGHLALQLILWGASNSQRQVESKS